MPPIPTSEIENKFTECTTGSHAITVHNYASFELVDRGIIVRCNGKQRRHDVILATHFFEFFAKNVFVMRSRLLDLVP